MCILTKSMNIHPKQRYRIRGKYSRKHSQGYLSSLLELYCGNDFYRVEIKGSAPYSVRLLDGYDHVIAQSNNSFNASQIVDTTNKVLFTCKIGIKEFLMSTIAVEWTDQQSVVIRPINNTSPYKTIAIIPDQVYLHINRNGFIAEVAKPCEFNAACMLASIVWWYELNMNMSLD